MEVIAYDLSGAHRHHLLRFCCLQPDLCLCGHPDQEDLTNRVAPPNTGSGINEKINPTAGNKPNKIRKPAMKYPTYLHHLHHTVLLQLSDKMVHMPPAPGEAHFSDTTFSLSGICLYSGLL